MVKAFLFWVVLKFRKYSPRPGVEYTHHPMHCMQTAVHTPAQLAEHAPHTGGTKYTPKTVVVFTDSDLYHLAYNHTCMIEQGWCPDDCKSCNFDDLTRSCLNAGAWPVIELSVLTFLLRFQISCHLSILYSPKCLLTNKFRLPFHRLWFLIRSVMNVEATLLSDSKSKWKLKTQWR
jgi:hypothetical protein